VAQENTGRLQVTQLLQSRKTDSASLTRSKEDQDDLQSILNISFLSHSELGYHSSRPAVMTVKLAQGRRRRNTQERLLRSSRICVCELLTPKQMLPLERRWLHTFSTGSLQDQLGVRQAELACTGQES